MPYASAGFFHGLFLEPQDRGDLFLLNVGLSPNYKPEESTLQCDHRENLKSARFRTDVLTAGFSNRTALQSTTFRPTHSEHCDLTAEYNHLYFWVWFTGSL